MFCRRALGVAALLAVQLAQLATAEGVITTVAGTADGFSGDGGPATSARLSLPSGVAVDGGGNVLIADTFNGRIRRVAADTGRITNVAGTAVSGYSGDGGPATSARLDSPWGVAVDGGGNVLIADAANYRIRRVAAGTGIITTVAGTGEGGFSGDGEPATSATLSSPYGVAVDGGGNVLIADRFNHRIRRVAAGTGVISSVAGNGGDGEFSGDGGPATSASLNGPTAVAVDSIGNLLIADYYNHRIRRVAAGTGTITTVAGNGAQIFAETMYGEAYVAGFSGDGGPATSAGLNQPWGVAVDGGGNVLIADSSNHRIRLVAAGTGVITTMAGNGERGFSGDGGPATSARMASPYGVAVDAGGNLLIADFFNSRIRRVPITVGATTSTGTPTSSTTATATPTSSATATATPTLSATATATPSVTGSARPTPTPAATFVFAQLPAAPLFGGGPEAESPSSASFPGGAVSMGPSAGVLFPAYSFASGRELWTLAPGAASPTLAWDVLPGGAGSEPSELTTLSASVTGGAPAWLFSARATEGAAPTLHAWSAGAGGLRCALNLATPLTTPLRPVVAAAGAYFVGTAAGAESPSLQLIPRSALSASALCAQGAPLPVSQPLPSVVPLSRVEHCGGKVVFLARATGEDEDSAPGLFWLGPTGVRAGADADTGFTPLPVFAQPPAAPAGDLLPYPRCMADGAVAFATAGGPVALVAPDGETTLLGNDDDAAVGAYSNARALAAVGSAGGLCFVANVAFPATHRTLFCWTPAGGLTRARAGPTVDASVSWALGTPAGYVYLPCTGPDGSGPHACAYAPATRTWAATSGPEVPYSSFTPVGEQLLFAAAGVGQSKPVLYATAALA